MQTSELEDEVTRLRTERDQADERHARLVESESDLRRRNVSLYERVRYLDSELRKLHTTITELVAGALGRQ